ncbi:MAG: restriction endonuclease subunit S [Methylovulum miyakonense]|uniref:restriction endonuclease subunit S n=1 Tax=Methylovulum miyakonense TaxID=645578 RepID=UPI003BB6AC30
MTSNFHIVKLGDYCNVDSGYAFKSERFSQNPQDINLVKGSNLGHRTIDWDEGPKWPKEEFEKLKLFELKANDVVLAMDRPVVGGNLKFAWLTEYDPKALLVQRVARLRAKEGLDQIYLRYVISDPAFRMYVDTITTGANIPHISGPDIRDYKFPLLPISTQQKIATILSAYDDLIENNLKRIKLLEEMAQITYEEWFVRLKFPGHETTPMDSDSGLPTGWEFKKLDDIFEFSNGYAFYTKGYSEKGYVVVDLGNISKTSDLIFSGNEKKISRALYQQSSKFHLKKYDVVIAMTDITKELGILAKSAIIDADDKYVLNQRVGRIRPKHDFFDYSFIYSVLNDRRFISSMHSKSKGAVQFYFNTSDIVDYMVVLPGPITIKQFQKLYKPFLEARAILKQKNILLAEARDILLPRLMTGMIDVEQLVLPEAFSDMPSTSPEQEPQTA